MATLKTATTHHNPKGIAQGDADVSILVENAIHARKNGFSTRVLLDTYAGVAAASTNAAIAELRAAGVVVV
jgi:hypothetical protein